MSLQNEATEYLNDSGTDKSYTQRLAEWLGSKYVHAAETVFDKNKKKYNLTTEDFRSLSEEAFRIALKRESTGKIANVDYLIQELGKLVKEKGVKNT